MRRVSIRVLSAALLFSLAVLAFQSELLLAADLSPRTVEGFERYVKAAEARMARGKHSRGDFLYIEQLPKTRYETVMEMLKQNGTWIERLRVRDASGHVIDVPDGMVHHWIGVTFIPGKSLASALNVLRDFQDYKNIYQPQVIRSQVISHQDDHYKTYMRLQQKTGVSVTFDTWYDIRLGQLDQTHGYSNSHSTRIQQVEDAGTPQEHLEPVGHDSGYLWRINSYWRCEERKSGVIIEWESIALSRPIPSIIAWFVRPLVRRIARESVNNMLTATRKAMLAEKNAR